MDTSRKWYKNNSKINLNNISTKVDELNTQKTNKSIAATIRRESLDYMVDVEPRHRKIKIVLDQDESANKSIIIVQVHNLKKTINA